MKAFLIDPHEKSVTEVNHTGGLEDLYKLTHCSTVTAVGFDESNDDTLFLDDEGLLGNLDEQAFFLISGYPEPLAGYALAVGIDGQGDTTEPQITLAELTRRVGWITLDEIRRTLA